MEEKNIDKGSTDGMYIKTATGRKFTKEMYYEYIDALEKNGASSKFSYKSVRYYKDENGNVIKYNYNLKKAYLLNPQNNKWIYSEEISMKIIDDPNCYERYYYFRDVFDDDISKTIRYFYAENGMIFKIIEEEKISYIFDVNNKCWILDKGLFYNLKSQNINVKEITFNDCYEVRDLDLSKGKHL